MDGELTEGGEPSKPKTLTEIFREVCPDYMAMGMSYDEFWNGPPSLVRDYRKAYDIRLHNEEWARHRMGLYVYTALLCVAPVMRMSLTGDKVEPGKYPDHPYPLTEAEARKQEEEREMENFKEFLARMEAESDRELKRREALQKEANENGRD